MVREYKATRSELIELKKQIKLSTTGHRLLKMKRDSLIAEFFNILDKAKGIRSGIQDKYDRAMERLSIAKAIEGTIGVKSAAFAALENPEMELTTKNIMGIVVPEIDSRSVKKRIDERGYGIIGTSSRIDEAAEAFEDLVEDIVIAAEIETTMLLGSSLSKRLWYGCPGNGWEQVFFGVEDHDEYKLPVAQFQPGLYH
ncbi:MAG: V-type ATP synthase subunit D [Candidatus Thermoplasmatota archaeon]|nr:V-type ATP synthase subunit D [Candidatus Thermoplasmatota archaeon]